MNVVLPAPFEPSSPVIPGPISTSRPASATVWPYRFTTPRAETTLPTPLRLQRREAHVGRRYATVVTSPNTEGVNSSQCARTRPIRWLNSGRLFQAACASKLSQGAKLM